MNTDSIELILNKLGTTLESIVPATIAYERKVCVIGVVMGTLLIVAGISLTLITIHRAKEVDISDDFIGMLCCGFGILFVLIGIVMMPINVYDLYMWSKFSEIKAYETILGWVG